MESKLAVPQHYQRFGGDTVGCLHLLMLVELWLGSTVELQRLGGPLCWGWGFVLSESQFARTAKPTWLLESSATQEHKLAVRRGL